MAERRARQRLTGAGFVAILASILLPVAASAQASRVLFEDDFDSGFGQWTETSAGGDASIGSETAASGQSMRLRWGRVAADSDIIDASGVTAASLSLWIRRGADSFSENPESGDDLVIQFRDSGGGWVSVATYDGGGTAGEIITPTFALPSAALHASLSIRLGLTNGSGTDFDYWHIDDLIVTGVTAGGGLGTCQDFESGLGGWTIRTAGGDAGISSATAQSGSNSLYTRWGVVAVTSQTTDLAGAGSVALEMWIRRGSDAFSENPDNGEDLVVEYRTSGGGWSTLETFVGGGTQGEIFVRSFALPSDALHASFQVRVRQTAGNGSNNDYWHVDDVCLTGNAPLLFSFEEDEWTGAASEVLESNGSGLAGTVFGGARNDDVGPALATNPGTCRYGVFDGVNDYIEIADDPSFDMPSSLTVSAWIYMHTAPSDLHTIVSKDWNYEFHINSSRQVYWWWNDPSGNVRSLTTSQRISLNRWYHIAVTYESGRQVIYVDGTPWATAANTGQLRLNDVPLFIGTDWNFISRAFDGFIDEVHIDSRAYSQTEVQALRDATHPCATAAAQFTLNHDSYGIHCLPEAITVNVIDSVAGTPLTSYNAQVRLDTQSGNGTWSLLSGSGALIDAVAGDGVALYDWPLGETQAQFGLYYPQGPPVIDVDASQVTDPGIRDTDAEGLLSFAPDGFTVTAVPIANPPGAIVPFAAAQTAAVPFDVHITAYGQTADDPVCGVIESYSGNRNLKFWSEYVDPGTGFRAVEVDGALAAAAEGSAIDQVVAFVDGQAQVTLKYKDAGSIRLSMKDDTTAGTALPGGIRGGTAAFVSRPADFVLSDVRDAAGVVVNPAPAGAPGVPLASIGNPFIAAGAPFRATVTAIDAEGDPTPNFGRESIPRSVELDPALVAPAGGNEPGITAAVGFAAFANGTSTGTDFTWSEVGIVQVTPSVSGGDYLGAGDVVGTVPVNVGRFVPAGFELVPNQPRFATACTAGPNDFTYAGQGFGYGVAPTIRATAVNAGGARTLNYTGAFFRIDETSLSNRAYTAAAGALDTSGVPPIAEDVEVTEFAPGIATIRFDAAGTTELGFARSAPEPPFAAAISLSIEVFDLDGVAAQGNPAVFDGGGAGIAFDDGAGGDGSRMIRFGRLRFDNAVGSERVDLPLPLVAEYFLDAATGFVRNVDDVCTTGVSLAFVTYTGSLADGDTCVRDSGMPGASGIGCAAPAPAGQRYAEPPIAGDFGVRLAAPGSTGSVIVDSTVPAWLRYDWNAALPGEENPAGIATFGLYGGSGSQIYLRELF